MPTINRIRVNNIKYNFGTQFYDDFLMRFMGKNTIYDLANGGGKSVLLLLMMQNMLPNSSLDEKQPVEKLFGEAGGSTTIHSLIEWRLDDCYVKDDFRYMLTGFCARKGKENAMEYFNYCIFYRDYGENDIKNLPLEEDGKRITYQGLKNYLKDISKKDLGVKAYVFDRRNEYMRFITEYGIFESHWELVRGINKTEGHVRTYFETNYKRARKVVEDLLIEQIIEKSFNNRLGIEGENDNMAGALFAIRNRLQDLTNRQRTISAYDAQVALLEEFEEGIEAIAKEYDKRDELLKNIAVDYVSLKGILDSLSKEDELLREILESAKTKELEYKKILACSDIYKLQDELEAACCEFSKTREKLDEYKKEENFLRGELKVGEAITQYKDYLLANSKAEATLKAVSEKGNDENLAQMKKLARRLAPIYNREYDSIKNRLDETLKVLPEKEALLETFCEKEREEDKSLAITEREIEDKKAKVKNLSEEVYALKSANSLTFEDTKKLYLASEAELSRLKVIVDEKQKEAELSQKLYDDFREELLVTEGNIASMRELLQASSGDEYKKQEERLLKLKEIYSCDDYEDLSGKIKGVLTRNIIQLNDVSNEVWKVRRYIDTIGNGRYVYDGVEYNKVLEYLKTNYEEDSVEGSVWYRQQPHNVRRDLIKRVPYICQSIIFKGDIELLKNDGALKNLVAGSAVVLIVGENIIYESRNAIGCENLLFAMKDMSFLDSEDERGLEINKLKEELSEKELELSKLKGKVEIMEDDYAFALSVRGASSDMELIKERLKELALKREALMGSVSSSLADSAVKKDAFAEVSDEYNRCDKNLKLYREINERNDLLDDLEAQVLELEKRRSILLTSLEKLSYSIKDFKGDIDKLNKEKEDLEGKLSELKKTYKNTFAPYVDVADEECDGDYQELLGAFMAYKDVYDNVSGDLNRAKSMAALYEDSANKAKRQIEYLGFDIDAMQMLYQKDEYKTIDHTSLEGMKARLSDKERMVSEVNALLDEKKEKSDLLKGAYENAIKSYKESYETEVLLPREECSMDKKDYELFLKNMASENAEVKKKLAANREKETGILLTIKEFEKPIKKYQIEVEGVKMAESIDPEAVKGHMSAFDELEREINKSSNIFYRSKSKLKDGLMLYKATELSMSVQNSVEFPVSREDADLLRDNLKETISLIELEKNNITKDIEDMLALKSAFESRCLDTCENIRQSLDKLASSSKITLDNKVIPIIKLSIPYVKDELKRERMSAYIEDIVDMCQSFPDDSERIKYIRDKLTWKKLFSVVVTDMNEIKLSLYKREQNASKSRYLRYEEAVGSTGQSQGIYIQFLIAIINYIASINAAAKGEGIASSTIFIDNPFGAAKDVYIWEPIFKLLAANHVQLVVPARGATPAIIGRFDINYILGQVQTGDLLQTVVMDFRSEINESGIEFERLEFEQGTLDLDI